MNIKRLFQSFVNAWRGIVFTFRHEQNFRVQLLFSVIVVIGMFLFHLRSYERIVVLLLIILVIVLELVNTTIDKFLDLMKPRLHTHVEVIKDVMAAAVLIASVGALIIGCIIFIPHIIVELS